MLAHITPGSLHLDLHALHAHVPIALLVVGALAAGTVWRLARMRRDASRRESRDR